SFGIGTGASCERDEVPGAPAARGVRTAGRAEAAGKASGYGSSGERERATLRAAGAPATKYREANRPSADLSARARVQLGGDAAVERGGDEGAVEARLGERVQIRLVAHAAA